MEHLRISQDPKVMVGKPVIRGTRIPVDLILRMLGGGHSVETILDSYPHLTREDILAAPAFAADVLGKLHRSAQDAALSSTEAGKRRADGPSVRRDPQSLVAWLRSIEPFDGEFPVIEDMPPRKVDI